MTVRRALAAVLLVVAALAPEAAAQEREDVPIAQGFSAPTAMALAPDGRIFVAEQGGRLRVVEDGTLLDEEFLQVAVTSSNERGLLGVTFDPQFATNRFVYVYYTRASPVVNRVSRFTASATDRNVVEPGSETVILDNISSATSGYHNGGAIHFGPDGKLYVAVGEGHTGSNAQSLTTLAGKLLRINPDGSIPTDNPFYGTASGINRAIWALGLRNPFTFDIQPATGRIFVNDVGQSTYEEINEAWADPENAGFNFGWPATEGPTSNPDYRTPFHYYGRSGGACAITGGAFYDPATANFPSQYANDYFFADFCAGWIKSLDLGTKVVSDFIAPSASRSPVDIKVAENGSLHYLTRGSTPQVRRVRYLSTATPPGITGHPDDATVTVGGSATFTVSASGSSPLTYRWQRNGADIPGATSSSYTVSNAQLADDGDTFRAIVTNAAGSATSDEATLHVTTDKPPTASIEAPARYSGGEGIAYSGAGTDPENGELTYTWRVDFHHDTHFHPFLPATEGAPAGSFTVPTRGETAANVWYRIHLTVRDEAGLTATAQRDVLPRTATIRLAASVAGARLELDGQPQAAPHAAVGVVGIERTLGAPSPQSVGGRTYEFVAWSDGGARAHTIATPAADTTYTATFREVTSAATPSAAGNPFVPTVGTPLPAGPRLRLRVPARVSWPWARRRGLAVRVLGVPGARVRAVVRARRRTLGARSRTVGASGERLLRVRVRRGRADRRRAVRLVVTATMPDGRVIRASRRIVLLPRS